MGAEAPTAVPPEPRLHVGLDVPAVFRPRFREQVLGLLSAEADFLEAAVMPGAHGKDAFDPADATGRIQKINELAALLDQLGWSASGANETATLSAPKDFLGFVLKEVASIEREISAGEPDRLSYATWITDTMGQFDGGAS